MLIIATCGLRSSGKDAVAEYLSDSYDFVHLDYTNHVLGPILRDAGKPIIRENLVDLAMDLRTKDGNDILTRMIAKKIRDNSAISGLRFPEEANYLRAEFGENFKLIAVECDPKTRYQRALERSQKGEGQLTYDQFLEKEGLSTERVIPITMKMADYTIDNSGSLGELEQKIDRLIKTIVQ